MHSTRCACLACRRFSCVLDPTSSPPLTVTSSAPLWGSEGMAESPARASPARSQDWGHEASYEQPQTLGLQHWACDAWRILSEQILLLGQWVHVLQEMACMPWWPLLDPSFRIKEKHSKAASLVPPKGPGRSPDTPAPLFQQAGVNREVSAAPGKSVCAYGPVER